MGSDLCNFDVEGKYLAYLRLNNLNNLSQQKQEIKAVTILLNEFYQESRKLKNQKPNQTKPKTKPIQKLSRKHKN